MSPPGWDRRRAATLSILFVVYFATAKLGLWFDALGGVATTVWPPTGIALTAFLLYGSALWPAVTLGAFLANFQAGMPLLSAGTMSAGNTLEAVLGAALLRRYGFRPALDRLRDVFLLVVLGGLVSTVASATGGVLGLWLGRIQITQPYREVWSVWWLGDLMGDLLVAPLLLTFSASKRQQVAGRPAEAAVLGVLLTATTLLIFGGLLSPWHTELLRESHVVFPLLLWAAWRFGPRGAATALFWASVLAIGCTVQGRGPFVRATRHESLLLLQSYTIVEVLTVLTLAAAIAERHRAVHARDQFISIASHELKTPLTSLRLRMTLLLRQLSRAALPQAERDHLTHGLERADLQVDRLTRLVGDLLDVSRLHGGRLGLTLESVILSDVVRDVVRRLADELGNAGCPIELEIDAAITGRWDRARIEQVLTNLLTNAIKYAPGRPIKIASSLSDDWTTITVSDQGPGIARDVHQKIFEPFERGSSRGDVDGLGLGLFIVNQIVQEHGGTVSVNSEPGEGATFRILLPRVGKPAPATTGQVARRDPT